MSTTPQQRPEILCSAGTLVSSYSNRDVTHYTGNSVFVMSRALSFDWLGCQKFTKELKIHTFLALTPACQCPPVATNICCEISDL
jgi:hypothetical protein